MGEDGALDRLRAEHCGVFLMNNAVLFSKKWCCSVLYSYCHFCGAEVPIHLPSVVYIHGCLREGTCGAGMTNNCYWRRFGLCRVFTNFAKA